MLNERERENIFRRFFSLINSEKPSFKWTIKLDYKTRPLISFKFSHKLLTQHLLYLCHKHLVLSNLIQFFIALFFFIVDDFFMYRAQLNGERWFTLLIEMLQGFKYAWYCSFVSFFPAASRRFLINDFDLSQRFIPASLMQSGFIRIAQSQLIMASCTVNLRASALKYYWLHLVTLTSPFDCFASAAINISNSRHNLQVDSIEPFIAGWLFVIACIAFLLFG